MPLVIPGLSKSSGDSTEAWTNKLVGKTVSDDDHSEVNFCKRDLPEKSRILGPNSSYTCDHVPERLNVHLKDDGTVSHVKHG